MVKILLADDEQEMLISIQKILRMRQNLDLTLCSHPEKALELARTENYDIIFTDLVMGRVSGMDVLRAAMRFQPQTLVILISGYGTVKSSVEAMREGAFDFLEKPFSAGQLLEVFDKALQSQIRTADPSGIKDNFTEIIHQSESMTRLLDQVRRVAGANMNILLSGESGTGKELVARAIHRLSRRSSQPFVPVNCGALPEQLVESELFGHERGAFTGAVRTKPGLLEFANFGSFFFDEVSEMSPSIQVKLLRMLEERQIRRIGGTEEINVDVRVIAASNKNLEKLIEAKLFREDLYYRLNTIQLVLPPLRERKEDIILLSNHFLNEFSARYNRPKPTISPEAELLLLEYTWPGNVRELMHSLERAFFLSNQQILTADVLALKPRNSDVGFPKVFLEQPFREAKEHITEQFEKEFLKYHLKQNKGNISQTALKCGIDRRTIHRLMKKFSTEF